MLQDLDAFSMMHFKDWLDKPDRDENWITVAKSHTDKQPTLESEFFTTSILAETDSSAGIIENCTWVTTNRFGIPEVWESDGKVCYDENSSEDIDGIKLEPFVLYRTWDNKPAKFELIQDFILFYNLYFDDKENAFKAVSNTGQDVCVIKIKNEQNDKRIEIKTKFLRN